MNEADKIILKLQNPGVNRPYLKFLEQRSADGRPLSRAELWKNHYQFEVPAQVLSYKGQAPAHVTMLLYSHADGTYRKSATEYDLVLKVGVEAKAKAGKLSDDSVERSFKRLQQDRIIRRHKQRQSVKYPGAYSAPRITFLIPGTDRPLQTIPSKEGLLTANGVDCIVIPAESLQAIKDMGRKNTAAKAVYLSALFLATKGLAETVYVKKEGWQRLSRLERCAFSRGLKYCTRRSLLTYKANVLILNDAHTGKPTEQWEDTGVWDGEPDLNWEVNFDDISDDQWSQLLRAEFGDFDIGCPQCGEVKKFGIEVPVFNCFNCGTKGTPADFIQQHHGFTWKEARQHIAAQLTKLEVVI
jgi:hypothetical protein